MILAVDAGNTNIVFALFDGTALKHSWRLETHTARTAADYRAWLAPLLAQAGGQTVTGAVIGSVVPRADAAMQDMCADMFGVRALMVDARTAGLVINLPEPETAGADRLVNAVAAARDYRVPAVIVDFGTATTFDVVNGRGEFCGGVIAPGPNLSARALSAAAAKLPEVEIRRPERVVGTDTAGAMQSGLYWGYIGLVEGILARIAAETGEKPFIIATGGLAGLFAGDLPGVDKVDKDLTLRGLVYIYQDHEKQKAA